MAQLQLHRRVAVGAEVQPGGATHFRVWAPDPREVSVVVERASGPSVSAPLESEADGYRSALIEGVTAGDRYRFRVDGELLPDPASRWQPDGPFGPSEVVDPARFKWSDHDWRGVTLEGQVIYEMHVGTFTPEGTWRSAMTHLPELAEIGITCIEIMPIAEFPGRFGWGYDGVFPYAPTRLYGTPDDVRTFVDRAHTLGLAVILDVVYNHFGPDGCVFRRYAAAYFSGAKENEWGDALNFDEEGSHGVREYFACNSSYWIDEFHLDGLRLDATQTIHDTSSDHILAVVGRNARAAAHGRSILLVAENEPQHVQLVRPLEEGGYGLDALWNDDFHHSAVVALTGRREAYYSDHTGAPQELISAAKYGYLYQGQRYAWQKQRRGTRAVGVPPAAFVNFIENHDQVANSARGERMRQQTTPGRYRAMTALLLLMPGTPMLFQGQEFGASSPFLYFADHTPELAAAVQKGRGEFLQQFPSLASAEVQQHLAIPHDPATFERCKLDWEERRTHVTYVRLHQDLLAMRRQDAAFWQQRSGGVDGAVLAAEAFLLRFLTDDSDEERLLLVNFGVDLVEGAFAEPLIAPPDGRRWQLRWSSEDPRYGGGGIVDPVFEGGWRLRGHSATVLRPMRI